MPTKWYLKQGDSGVIAQGSTDFDFVKPASAKRGDLIIARVGIRDGFTPAPVTPGDWTSVGNSPTTSNSTTGTGEAISQDFVWYHIYGNADPDWTFSRSGTTVCLRGSITLAPAIGYSFSLAETQTGTVATATTGPATANFTTTIDDELIAVFLSAGRNATWTNWDATSPSDASGASGYGTVGLIDPTTSWKRLQSNGSTSGNDISGSIGVAVKATAGATGNITVATNSLNVRPGWVGMRWQQVQATTLKVVNSGAAANYPTPGSVTIPFTPTSGNTLFAFVAVDKDATSDVTITGWTRVMQERSGSAVAAALFRKISDGTESSFDPSYTGSGSGENVFFIEIEGEVEIDVSATATTNLSTPAKTSGTATTANTTAAGGLALAFWCNDSYGSCDTSTSEVFDNDFIMAPGPTVRQYYSNADPGTPAIAVGWKEIPSSGTAVSTAFTYVGDTDDENLLFLIVLKESGATDHAVTPNTIASGSPTVGQPALTQDHALSPTGVTSASVTGQPGVTENVALSPTGVSGGAPVVGSPALTQDHATTPTGVSGGTPTVGTPALTQNHAVSPSTISAGAPTVGTPTATEEDGNTELDPTGISAGSPTVGQPALNQTHAFNQVGVSGGAPTVGTPALVQNHALTPTPPAGAAPIVGSPLLSQIHVTVETGVSSSPTVGSPAVTQNHALSPTGVSSSPAVGLPILDAPVVTGQLPKHRGMIVNPGILTNR